jgi:hypothetical protein
MKRQCLFCCALFFMLITGNVYSQPGKNDLNFIRCNYCNGLKSDNCGVTVASLINVMRMYHQYPDGDYQTIYGQLDTLSEQGATKQIRFMAGIIKDYFDGARNLDGIMNYSFEEIYVYFKILSNSTTRQITSDYRDFQ